MQAAGCGRQRHHGPVFTARTAADNVPRCRLAQHNRGEDVSEAVLEWTAVAFSIAGVWLMVQRRLLGWPLGLVAVALYTVVFAQARLYADALLQLVFGGFVLYGWYHWRRQAAADGRPSVVALPTATLCRDLALGLAGGLTLGALLHTGTDADLPWLDSLLAGFSLVAQWWQARRHAAAWAMWIAVDVAYIGLYAHKGLHATALLYLVFIALAARGLYSWSRAARQAAQTEAG